MKRDKKKRKEKRSKVDWDNTPSPNPRYGGKTPLEIARTLLRTKQAAKSPGN